MDRPKANCTDPEMYMPNTSGRTQATDVEDIPAWSSTFRNDEQSTNDRHWFYDKISLWQGDITKLRIDAIVNAASTSLLGDGGIDGAIHSAAGADLYYECKTLNGCMTGDAKITRGHCLPAKHIIHTVGPIGEHRNALASCYRRSLEVLVENKLRTICFCCISTGTYGYPNRNAAQVALNTVFSWLETDDNKDKIDKIVFCTFLRVDKEIYQELLAQPLQSTEQNGQAESPYTDESQLKLEAGCPEHTTRHQIRKDFDIFISHRKRKAGDQGIADTDMFATLIKEGLKAKGFSVFLDKDNLQEIHNSSLHQKVQQSRMLIIIVDPKVAESDWCLREWMWANDSSIPIFLVYNGDSYRLEEIQSSITTISDKGCQFALKNPAIRYNGDENARIIFFNKLEQCFNSIFILPAQKVHRVTVPERVTPGSSFRVLVNDEVMTAVCPANVSPGMQIRITVSMFWKQYRVPKPVQFFDAGGNWPLFRSKKCKELGRFASYSKQAGEKPAHCSSCHPNDMVHMHFNSCWSDILSVFQ